MFKFQTDYIVMSKSYIHIVISLRNFTKFSGGWVVANPHVDRSLTLKLHLIPFSFFSGVLSP